jgi:hypothetical protein
LGAVRPKYEEQKDSDTYKATGGLNEKKYIRVYVTGNSFECFNIEGVMTTDGTKLSSLSTKR